MPDELKDWREELFQQSGGAPQDMRPDRRLYNNVLYPSIAAMEAAKAREEAERDGRRKRVMDFIAAKYAGI